MLPVIVVEGGARASQHTNAKTRLPGGSGLVRKPTMHFSQQRHTTAPPTRCSMRACSCCLKGQGGQHKSRHTETNTAGPLLCRDAVQCLVAVACARPHGVAPQLLVKRTWLLPAQSTGNAPLQRVALCLPDGPALSRTGLGAQMAAAGQTSSN
jgi:hypothetical protein